MNRIEHFRKSVGLTQQKAAAAAGWKHQSRWSGYERCDRTPDIHDAQTIVQVLVAHGAECSIDDVFPPSIEKPKPEHHDAAEKVA